VLTFRNSGPALRRATACQALNALTGQVSTWRPRGRPTSANIAAGIADRERSDSPDLRANINPTFNWVRLARRVPVPVKPDVVPQGVELVVGRTATVTVESGNLRTLASVEPGSAAFDACDHRCYSNDCGSGAELLAGTGWLPAMLRKAETARHDDLAPATAPGPVSWGKRKPRRRILDNGYWKPA
jgi:hypothetical protein